MAPGSVYAIRMEGTSLVKIGVSRNPHRRLQALQVAHPEPLELLACEWAACPAEVERALHQRLRPTRRRGEWFDVTGYQIPKLMRQVARAMEQQPDQHILFGEHHDPRDDLRQWMAAHDRGPTWVAERAGWTREMISYVYHKRKKMSRKLARDLQERLGIAVRWTPEQPIVDADEPPLPERGRTRRNPQLVTTAKE